MQPVWQPTCAQEDLAQILANINIFSIGCVLLGGERGGGWEDEGAEMPPTTVNTIQCSTVQFLLHFSLFHKAQKYEITAILYEGLAREVDFAVSNISTQLPPTFISLTSEFI